MAIVQKQITLNNSTYYYTYSDAGYNITDGIDIFVTSIDDVQKTYTETNVRNQLTNERSVNKVTSISSISTDIEYPSAKCVYDVVKVKLENTATGTNGLSILGTPSTVSGGTNIGDGSTATVSYSTALGKNAKGQGQRATALGYNATANGTNSIQIGYGTNSDASTLCIGFNNNNYQLLDGTTGKIPSGRLDIATSISSNSTDTEVVSAKCVYDLIGNITSLLQGV